MDRTLVYLVSHLVSYHLKFGSIHPKEVTVSFSMIQQQYCNPGTAADASSMHTRTVRFLQQADASLTVNVDADNCTLHFKV